MRLARPTESQEQQALIKWAAIFESQYPGLDTLYAIPNGGARDKREGHKLNLEGVRAGVVDLHLPVAKHGYHGLWIEMKTISGTVSELQKIWLEKMNKHGHKTAICRGWQEAAQVIISYLS